MAGAGTASIAPSLADSPPQYPADLKLIACSEGPGGHGRALRCLRLRSYTLATRRSKVAVLLTRLQNWQSQNARSKRRRCEILC